MRERLLSSTAPIISSMVASPFSNSAPIVKSMVSGHATMMAEKPDKDEDEAPEEVFTDLQGRPDPVEEDDEDALDAAEDDDDDVIVPDPDDEDETGADSAAGGDPEPEPEPEPEPVTEPQPDAHDYQLRMKDLENCGLKAQMLDQQEAFAKSAKTQAEAKLSTATDRLKAAKEKGDTDAEIAVSQEILDARDAVRDADARLVSITQGRGLVIRHLTEIGYDAKTNTLAPHRPGKEPGTPGAQPQGRGKHSKLGPQFVAANKWMADPKFADDAAILRALDRKLLAEGKIDMNTPAYFSELATRFNRTRPGLVRGLDNKLVATGTKQRGNGAGKGGVMPSATGGRGTAPKDAKGVRLDDGDFRNMKRFGMDPQNKKHRTAYLREKQADVARTPGRA